MIGMEAWDRGNIGRATSDRPAGTGRFRSLVALTPEAVAATAPRGNMRLSTALAFAVLPLLLVAASVGCVETKQLAQVPLNSSPSTDATTTPQIDRDTRQTDRDMRQLDKDTQSSTRLGTQSDTQPGPPPGTRSGKAPQSATANGGSRIPVIATFSILGEWAERVAGDHARVVTLVGPGGDAHTYEPTPQATALIADARLVFEIGLNFEGWLDKVYQASGSRATRHTVTRAVRPRFVGPLGPTAELDPHVWQSPKLADRMVEEVVDALAAVDPSHAVEYRRRGDAYREELRTLDVEVRGLLAAVPRDRRVLVTTHDTFGYFAAEYDFEVLSVLESFSSEGGEPSAGELAAVIERIKARRVPAVFAENILDPRTTEKVAKEAGVAVVGTLYTDALGLPDTAGATYLGMMRHNARAIAEALR